MRPKDPGLRPQPRFIFPTEHGAYIVLFASWFIGIFSSQIVDPETSILVLGVFFSLFLAQEAIRRRVRGTIAKLHPFTFFLLGAAATGAGILLMAAPSLLLVAIPVCILALAYFRMGRRSTSVYLRSVIGFLLLSLTTPAVMIANPPPDYQLAGNTWVAVAGFVTSSVLVVGIRLGQPQAHSRARIFHLLYALITFMFLFIGVPIGIVLLAVVASIRYVLIGIRSDAYQGLSIKTVGIVESIVTAVAVMLTAVLS